MNHLDRLLVESCTALDGYRTTTDLRQALVVHLGDPQDPRWPIYLALYSQASDTLREKIDTIADAAMYVRDGIARDHDAPCYAWDAICDSCRQLNADLLADAVRDLKVQLGDRLTDVDVRAVAA